jgi:hypothetical protein
MGYNLTVKRAKELEAEDYVITLQHPTGVLVIHKIAELEELTMENGLKSRWRTVVSIWSIRMIGY